MKSTLTILSVLLLPLLFAGCDDSPSAKIHRGAKVAALAVLADDATKADELAAVADRFDELAAADNLTDSLIAELAGELVRSGQVDRREALIFAAIAQELWTEFRPEEGVLPITPKVRDALSGFTRGIREAVTFSRALDG